MLGCCTSLLFTFSVLMMGLLWDSRFVVVVCLGCDLKSGLLCDKLGCRVDVDDAFFSLS